MEIKQSRIPHNWYINGKWYSAEQACQMAIINDPECNHYRKELEKIELNTASVCYELDPHSPNGPTLKRTYTGTAKRSIDLLTSALKTRMEEIKKIYSF